MKSFLTFILSMVLLSGCASNDSIVSWETIGITSTGTHNTHVDEDQKNHVDDLKNQVKIAQITADVCSELKYAAKKADDDAAWERAIVLEQKARAAAKEAGILSEVEWSKSPPPAFDFMSIITMILSAVGIAGVPGVAIATRMIQTRNKALIIEKKKARKYAKSTTEDEYEED